MKKSIMMVLILVLACTGLTGCGDPQADAIAQFVSDDMADANKAYKQFTTDYSKINNYTDVQEATDFCNNTLIKELDDVLDKAKQVKVEEKEVKDLKEKYIKAIETYKQGVTEYVDACATNVQEDFDKANETFTAANTAITTYNDTVKSLSKKYGLTVKE